MTHSEQRDLFTMGLLLYSMLHSGGTVKISDRRNGGNFGDWKVRDWVLSFIGCASERHHIAKLGRHYDKHAYCPDHIKTKFWHEVDRRGLERDGWIIYRIFYSLDA
jgi:hypothetical protein